MMAFRATDGSKICGWHTIPGPGEAGSDTWKNPASLEHGGGGTWTSYSLDPALVFCSFRWAIPDPISTTMRGRVPTCSPTRLLRLMR